MSTGVTDLLLEESGEQRDVHHQDGAGPFGTELVPQLVPSSPALDVGPRAATTNLADQELPFRPPGNQPNSATPPT